MNDGRISNSLMNIIGVPEKKTINPQIQEAQCNLRTRNMKITPR